MKNLRIFLFAVAGLLFASCDDAIDITQPSELTPEETFETVTDMQLGLNAVYSSLPGENSIAFTSIFTDEVAVGRSNGGQGISDGGLSFLLNNNDGSASSIWVSNYFAINLATRLIEAAPFVIVEEGSAEETTKNGILAQAYALRAYCHFQLLSYYSTDLTDDSALGVIAISTTPAVTDYLPRNTNGEVFALINSDLDFASANVTLPSATNVVNKVFVTNHFILALKARMALYRGQFDAAKTFVDELDVAFNPSAPAAYQGIWQDVYSANNELIFAIDRSLSGQTGNFYQIWSSVNSSVTGSPFFEVDRSLFNLVNMGSDVRKTVIADATSLILPNYEAATQADYIQNDVLPVGKYPGNGQQNLLNDIKVFRFSEMILIRAEFYANAGQYTEAINQVNLVRAARYGNASGNLDAANFTTAQPTWAAIMDERRAELAFEGHRYIDIKRLGQKAGKGVTRDPKDCAFNGFCTLAPTDYRFTLPIPRDETASNTSIVQNPGY